MTEADHTAAASGSSTPEAGLPATSAEPVRTGAERVDEVIRAVEELEDRPVEEHVGVFESAHAELRRALDAADDPDAEDPDADDAAGAPEAPRAPEPTADRPGVDGTAQR